MLQKEYKITKHFLNQFQERAKNHFRRIRHKDIEHKIKNIMDNINHINDLIFLKDTYFLETKLSRDEKKPFYFLIKDDGEYFSLITIYTHDMFMKRYGSKRKE